MLGFENSDYLSALGFRERHIIRGWSGIPSNSHVIEGNAQSAPAAGDIENPEAAIDLLLRAVGGGEITAASVCVELNRQMRDHVMEALGDAVEPKLQGQVRHPAGAGDEREAIPIDRSAQQLLPLEGVGGAGLDAG